MLTAYFPPEIGSASHLFFELGQKLVEKGHEVRVITGFPRYNVNVKNLPQKYRAPLYLKEKIGKLEVIRLKTLSLPRAVPLLRGIDQFVTSFIFLIGGIFLRGNLFDLILVYSPPLPLGLTAFLLGKLKRRPFILNVQDLFPQSAIDLGLLRNRFLIRIFESLERWIYRKASLVTVHSEGNRRHVLSKGITPRKVAVVPNWVDTEAIRPGERCNGFRTKFGFHDEFIISFAGVIGRAQDLDTVIDCAYYLRGRPSLLFLLIGEGSEKERLQAKVSRLALENVKFLPMQPRETYASILQASDVCLVTLRREVKTPVVPSKLLGIMAAGRPVIASVPLRGDAPEIIQEARCGLCVEPENPKRFAEAILLMVRHSSKAKEWGRNGRRYAEAHFSLENCANLYESSGKEILYG